VKTVKAKVGRVIIKS